MKQPFVRWVVAFAAASLFSGIARAEEGAATELKPTPLTVKAEGVHPRDLLAELSKAAGVSVEVWPENLWTQNYGRNGPPKTVTVDLEDKPFWTVMDAFCKESKLYPMNMGNNRGVTLQWRGGGQIEGIFGKRPVAQSENGVVVATQVQRNHTLDLNGETPTANRRCGLSIEVYVDPRLRMTNYDGNAKIESATDENGNSLYQEQPGNPGGRNLNQAYCSWKLDGMFIPLDYDPEKSHKLASIKGSVRIVAAGAVEKMEITDLSMAQGFDKSIAGRHITIEEFKLDEKHVNMKITIEREDMPDDEWRSLYSSINQNLRLETEDGKRIGLGGGGGGSDKKVSYTFNTNWGGDMKPTKLIWEIPTKFHDVDLPFEFKDLTLP
jgi:hypothetical protein